MNRLTLVAVFIFSFFTLIFAPCGEQAILSQAFAQNADLQITIQKLKAKQRTDGDFKVIAKVTVSNIGTETAVGPFSISLFLSDDAELDSSDELLDTKDVLDNLLPGETTAVIKLKQKGLPPVVGLGIVVIDTENVVTESDEENNILAQHILGATSPLLTNQTEFAGTFPSLTPITYTTKDGEILTVELAFEGLVSLLVTPTVSVEVVQDIVIRSGGTVIDAIPLVGIYTISVDPGEESAVLSVLFEEDFVIDGTPAFPVVPADLAAIDFFTEIPFVAASCGNPHGDHVAAVLDRGGQVARRINLVSPIGFIEALTTTGDFIPRAARLMIDEMEATAARQERIVINLSLQSISSKLGDEENIRTACMVAETADGTECRNVQSAQLTFFSTILAAINSAAPAVRDNALIVIAAGNAGVDQTRQLDALQRVFPDAFKHIKIVGATDTKGEISKTMNFSSSGMIFARGTNVPTVPGTNCTGTSFAAPEVARILDDMWRAAPSLTSSQVSEAFDQALEDCSRPTPSPQNTVPQNADGGTPQDFISCAIEKAKVVDTVTNAFLGVGKGPDDTGTGRVTSNPAGIDCGIDCSEIYPIDTEVELTAQEDDGSTFGGWSGACTGIDKTCTLIMDSDQATTAFFKAKEEPPPSQDTEALAVTITSASCTLFEETFVGFKTFQYVANGTTTGFIGSSLIVLADAVDTGTGGQQDVDGMSCTWSIVGSSNGTCQRRENDPPTTNWTSTGSILRFPGEPMPFSAEIKATTNGGFDAHFGEEAVASTTITCG